MVEPTPFSAPPRGIDSSHDGGSPGRGVAYGVAFGVMAWALFAFIVFA